MSWSVFETTLLINLYKKYPTLWDKNHEGYENELNRQKCLEQITTEMNEHKNGITVNAIERKIALLRSKFFDEKCRMNARTLKFGIEETESKWYGYEDLKFIDIDENEDQFKEGVSEEIDWGDDSTNETIGSSRRRKSIMKDNGWTKSQTLALIKIYRNYPILYDNTHPFYMNINQRLKCFRQILEKIKPVKADLTIDTLKKKVRILRNQFIKEKKLQRRSVNYCSNGKIRDRLWSYKHLKFLDQKGNFNKKAEENKYKNSLINHNETLTKISIDQPDDCYVSENENEIYVKSFVDSDENTATGTRKPIKEEVPQSKIRSRCYKLIQKVTEQMQDDEADSYMDNDATPQAILGRMVELELLKVSDNVFEDTKWKIIKLLEEASKLERNANLALKKQEI